MPFDVVKTLARFRVLKRPGRFSHPHRSCPGRMVRLQPQSVVAAILDQYQQPVRQAARFIVNGGSDWLVIQRPNRAANRLFVSSRRSARIRARE